MRRVHSIAKRVRTAVGRRPEQVSTLLIVGCQRSGTSLLLRLFDDDPRVAVFGEKSKLFSSEPGNRRLLEVETVVRTVEQQRAPLVVIKPLVESQRTPELLDSLPNAHAVWMYRHYRDTAISNLDAFGHDNGFRDLEPILRGDASNWRSEAATPEVRDRITAVSADIGQADAAALFWYARNSLLYDTGAIDDERVSVRSYDSFVTEPVRTLDDLYATVGLPPPAHRHRETVTPRSIGRGAEIDLCPEIEAMCSELLDRLVASEQ